MLLLSIVAVYFSELLEEFSVFGVVGASFDVKSQGDDFKDVFIE